jgi:hypothetical protein
LSLFVIKILSFLAGVGLGVINFRLFVKSINGISSEGSKNGVSKQLVKAGIFRHLFIFLAGICLIRGASFAPFHLCGGLLLATFVCRINSWRA